MQLTRQLRLSLLTASAVWLVVLFSALPLSAAEPLWLRFPAISPDGASIAFSYRGDLYTVPAAGGAAALLTLSEAHDSMPVWSRDGEWIAFASDRYGNFDVYVIPAAGGESRRLTFHSSNDYPSDFSPDGSAILFTSVRLDAHTNAQFPSGRLPELYSVPTDAGRPRQVLTTPADQPRYSVDGNSILYQDQKGYEDPWRKHHTSAVTRDLWIYDIGTGSHRQLTDRPGEDRDPVQVGDDVFFLSEESGTFNVHKMAVSGGPSAQVTAFERHPVRSLSASIDGTLAYTYDGRIYRQAAGGEPQALSVAIRLDDRHRAVAPISISDDASDFAVAPSGKEIAFIVRGEVFVASVKEGTTKRITDTPQQERSVSFRPDGRAILYAAERDQSWDLYQTVLTRESEKYFFDSTVLEEEPILVSDAETFQPSYSPDGKEVAFIESSTALKVLNLESQETREILAETINFSYADGDQSYSWSPDGKWFLVEYLKPDYWFGEVGLVSSAGGEIVNTTENGYYDFQPKWMMAGKMMLWFTDRDGLQSHANTGTRQGDVYAQFFTQESFDRFQLSEEELAIVEESEEDEDEGEDSDDAEDSKKEKKSKKKKGDDEKDAKKDETKALEPIEIDLDGLRDRRARLTIHSSHLSDAVVTPDGEKLLYLARFEKGYDLWQTELRTQETKILAALGKRGGRLELSGDGESVFVLAGGRISKIEIESGDVSPVGFSGEMNLDRAAERAYLFEHVWRQVSRKFYDPEFHGADWDGLKADYAKFLPHIDNNWDFKDLLGELLGELNASHTGARHRPSSDDGDDTASLGLFFDASHQDAGLLIAEVMPKSPVVQNESRIASGVVIEKIDGHPIENQTNYYPLLNRKAGQKVLLSLLDPESGDRWEEVVKPISDGQEGRLLYDRWIESRRIATDELSGGRIGYVHVRSMSDSSYRSFYEEVMGRQTHKEALIVDTRFNGGGDLVDDLSNYLSGERYMDFRTRDGRSIGGEPQRLWTRPSIVLMSEGNYSDAHCFPWAYTTKGIGKLVGMPVAGTCTFVWWERLQDESLVFGIPNLAVTDVAGNPLENQQLEPDIRVANEFGPVAEGRDQQLEAAVTELLKQLE